MCILILVGEYMFKKKFRKKKPSLFKSFYYAFQGIKVNILNERVLYKGSSYKIHSVIRVYLQDIFSYLETGDLAKMNFPKLYGIRKLL